MNDNRSVIIVCSIAAAVWAAGCKKTTSPSANAGGESPAATASSTAPKAPTATPTGSASSASASSQGHVLTASRRWSFDSDPEGKVPADFFEASGKWAIVAGKDAGVPGQVLMQQNQGHEGQFNVLLSSAMQGKDVDLTVRMRAHSGKIDQGGGLVWRAKDVNNYYVARYNPLEDNYRLYFVRDGHRAMIANADVHIDKKAWHTLRVTMKGQRITCYLDGKQQMQTTDPTFTQAGKIGLWTKADAVTWFDDLRFVGQ